MKAREKRITASRRVSGRVDVRGIQAEVRKEALELGAVTGRLMMLRDRLMATADYQATDAAIGRTDGHCAETLVYRLACDLSHVCGWPGEQDGGQLADAVEVLDSHSTMSPSQFGKEETRRLARRARGDAKDKRAKARESAARTKRMDRAVAEIRRVRDLARKNGSVVERELTTALRAASTLLDSTLDVIGLGSRRVGFRKYQP
jgi:hypothetical protein